MCEQTGLPPGDATLLLHLHSWSSERLLERWWESRERVLSEAGLTQGTDPPPWPAAWRDSRGTPVASVLCAVTLEDVPPASMDALPCGHWFSRSAWSAALSSSMTDSAAAQTVRCLAAPGCRELVRSRCFAQVLPPALLARWHDFAVRRFARDSRGVVWCPGVECPYALAHTDNVRVPEDVTCRDGHVFCFACARLGGHRPATCDEVGAWEARDNIEGASLAWIATHTKACPNPKCRGAIERSSGCNKVVCTACNTAMCWACGAEYFKAAGHAYPEGAWTCNKPAGGGFGGSAEGLDAERFLHYRTRVVSSRESAAIAERELPTVSARCEELASLLCRDGAAGGGAAGSARRILHGGDLDFLTAGLIAVIAGRRFLAYTYIHAFALRPAAHGAELALFADQQSVLEGTVERLQQRVEASAIAKLINELKVGDGALAALSSSVAAAAASSGGSAAAAGGGLVIDASCTDAPVALSDISGAYFAGASVLPVSVPQCALDKFDALRIDVLTMSRAVHGFMGALSSALEEHGTILDTGERAR